MFMPRSASRILTLALSLVAVCAPGVADEFGVAARLHPWGGLDPGVWKIVRVVTETLDAQGQVASSSTTDTKTTLREIDNDGVALEIATCMEVAGKRFQAEPQTVRQGFHGELNEPRLKFEEPVDGQVVIENRKIPCKVQRLEIIGPNKKTSVRLCYSMSVSPYVLRRECVARDTEGKGVLSETDVEVTSLDMPVRVLGETRSGAYVKTISRNAVGTVTTLAVVVSDVPGGVVSHSSKEVNKSGRVVRRSTLELIDYCADVKRDRSGLLNRKHPIRRAKPPPQ
jgi:hypothetical protein